MKSLLLTLVTVAALSLGSAFTSTASAHGGGISISFGGGYGGYGSYRPYTPPCYRPPYYRPPVYCPPPFYRPPCYTPPCHPW